LFKNVGIIARIDKTEAVNLALNLVKHLEERGVRPICEPQLASRIGCSKASLDEADLDLAVVIGGDGTILRAVHTVRRNIPFFTVNLGVVGFLADVDPSRALLAIDQVLDERFIKDECFMLSNNTGLPDALNEVRIGVETPSQMAELEVALDGFPIARDRVDAILVATTTGSSGYTLSAGGGIVDPRLKAIVIVPVCPLSANFRPYIVPWDCRVSVKTLKQRDIIVLVDGQFEKKLSPPREVEVKRSGNTVTFLRTESNFYTRLRRRLAVTSLNPT